MNVPKWLERLLRWGLWLFRPKYLIGVFPVVIDDRGNVLLIRKRLGAATGWQLPGGAKAYGVSFEDAACQELRDETGLTALPHHLRMVRMQCHEPHRDVNVAYLVLRWEGSIGPRDTTEIAEARWVPFLTALDMLYPLHRPMLEQAWFRWHIRQC